jgi:hypothetical protein
MHAAGVDSVDLGTNRNHTIRATIEYGQLSKRVRLGTASPRRERV